MKSKKQSQSFEIEFTPEQEDEFVDNADYPSWTTIISIALLSARDHPEDITFVDVGKEESARLVENALMNIAEQGNMDALQIEVRVNTLH